MQMNRKTLAAGLLSAVSAISLPVGDAGATTLMDLLRGGPAANKTQGASKPLFGGTAQEIEGAISDPDPLPKITGPRYYTYKTDALRVIQTAKFVAAPAADATVTSSTAAPAADPRAAMAGVKVSAPDEIAKAIEDYYGSGRPLIWVQAGEISPKAQAAITALAAVGDVGLDAEDYAVTAPDLSAITDPAARDLALMQFELTLSAKVLTYVQDTERGRVDPNKLSGYHDFKRKTVNLKPVLNMLRLSPDVAAYLRTRDPDNTQFLAMKAELVRLRAENVGGEAPITIAPGTVLKPGKDDPELANVIKAIGRKASDALKVEHSVTLANYAGTPQYTPELVALVEGFQKENGLKPDGVVGQATIRKLVGDTNQEKINKLIVSMEQRRWLPDDLGSRFVFINQPAFQAYYFNEGKQQIAMRVVVGSKSNQTYFFQDQIETVEFNPYWGVPQSIIVNEMLPKLRADPSYLDRLGYEVSHGGRKVASSQVNWNTNPNVDVRQPPGGDNALGELKILFPNSHAIYMHDTPSKSFFQRDMRALSHGCVRLAEPRVMAAAVMGTTVAEIGKQIASGQNRAVSVPQKIPVYVSYFTAWPDEAGGLHFYADVYDRDAHTMKAFAAITSSRSGRS
ncbi:L,D-transpeptidase family protein [Rhizobium sp. RU36D]|uniref:L,D-transpeptidase family protein n=1 Tax=Rhizobium sp. RU36D TaxID=1907415 RepID=UPI0009D8A406|nr:L,D-transpeptidase family protein [Rhizobium sp. RU36D]SMC80772.1 Murein L,D-transpeptidase YcbB/YkuD [Rhizobium sp. RU36D]